MLKHGEVLMHAMVIGELACGSLRHRDQLLGYWKDLPRLPSVSDDDALGFINYHRIMSRGLGFIDAHLLAAVAKTAGTKLWTRDRRLAEVAEELGLHT
jgi:predicted nucleic acid-binding protein